MASPPKAPPLLAKYVTAGDRRTAEWHLLLQRVTFGAGLALMFASVYSLHWACNLIGLDGWAEPIAWLVPLAIEVGMAATASTATTVRKNGTGYYIHLWVIFSFLMALAQMANIGHAIASVSGTTGGDLAVLPGWAIYGFACAFAALFPLGGTMFVHVSGFLRVHGVGASWITEDAELVRIEATPGQSARPAPRASAPKPAAPSRASEPAPARAPQERASAPAPAESRDEQRARARAIFDTRVAANPYDMPTAKEIYTEAGLTEHEGNFRKVFKLWRVEHEEKLRAITGEPSEEEKDAAIATPVLAAVPAAKEDAG